MLCSDMALKPGTRLGQYEIRGLIGAGGMGEVYQGHDTKLERDVLQVNQRIVMGN